MTNPTEVQTLLENLGRAVTSGDGRAVAELWETPALVVHDEQVMAVSSAQEIESFFGGAKEQYNARGITDTCPEVRRLDWPTSNIAIVEVRWPYLDAAGATHGYETSTYTLRRNEAGALKVRVAVMHGGTEG